MACVSKKQDYELLSGCLLFSDKQKFQHFLKNFGTGLANTIEYDTKTNNNPKHK